MKKVMFALMLLGLLTTPAFAEDIVISITIPDAAVSRVAAMINSDLDCGELGPKACLKQELIRHIRYLVKTYEAGIIIEQGKTEIKALTEPEVE